MTDPIWWFFLFWLPKFLNAEYGLKLARPGPPLIVIYLMADVGSIGGGWLSGRLIKRGWSVNRARKTAMFICALASCRSCSRRRQTLWVAVGLIGLAAAAHQGWSANVFTLTSDMFPRRAVGSVVGLGGFAGAVGGMMISTFTGFPAANHRQLRAGVRDGRLRLPDRARGGAPVGAPPDTSTTEMTIATHSGASDKSDRNASLMGVSFLCLLMCVSASRAEAVYFDWFQYTRRDAVFSKPLPPGSYRNPILAGFYPDPSITRAGNRFYLVNSTFTYFPGIPIFESSDLVHWRQVGNVIERPAELDFDGLSVSRGVFAPTIEYHDGTFYVLNTAVDSGGNYFSTAKSPAGPWSDPIWLPDIEGIDPSALLRCRRQGLHPQQWAPEGHTSL